MRDDYNFNFMFIDLVKQNPCLYDSTRSDYKSNNRQNQDAAWINIAKETNESVPDCKEKWKNLRACYTRHLKNMNRRATPTGKHSKPYYLAEKLNFLYNFTKAKSLKDDNKTEESKTETEQDPLSPHKDYDVSNESSDIETPVTFHKVIKKSRKESQSEVKTPTNAVMQPTLETVTQDKNPEFIGTMCPDLAFLYSLLPDLKEMNGAQKRKFKIGILSLTNDILQDNDKSTSSFMEDIPEGHVPPRHKNIRTY